MGRVEREYTKLLTKALFQKLRKQRITMYALIALAFFFDLFVNSDSNSYQAVFSQTYLQYTYWAILITLVLNTYNIFGCNLFSNLSFLPSTKKTRYMATVLNQFIILLSGQILALLCYFLQYFIQTVSVRFTSYTYIVMSPKLNIVVVLKGLILYLLIGILYIVFAMMIRRAFCYYQKISLFIVGIVAAATMIKGIIIHQLNAIDHYTLSEIGTYIFKIQSFGSIVLKMLCLAAVCLLIQFVISKLKSKKLNMNKIIYWVELGLVLFCLAFIYDGARNLRYNWSDEQISFRGDHKVTGVSELNIQKKVGDGQDYSNQSELVVNNIPADVGVVLKKYKANPKGQNPIGVQFCSEIQVGGTGYADKLDVKINKEKATDNSLTLSLDLKSIVVKKLDPYAHIDRYTGIEYMSLSNFCNYGGDQCIVIHYPDNIKWSKYTFKDNNGDECEPWIENYEDGKEDSYISDELKEKIENAKFDN